MEEHRNHHHQQQQQRRRQYYQQQQQQQQERHEGAAPEPSSERRIARSTSGKDRHSKVRTAKGLRDRRVRLSAHTAIRFYDVQDRLGFDRPSKAVDWLIRKAGPAIAELPPSPTAAPTSSPLGMATGSREEPLQLGEASTSLAGYNFDNSYLTPPLDSEVIAETIKSFFPIHHNNTMPSPPNFHNYHSQPLPYNTSNQVQEDLQLSLQSSHHPITTMTTTTISNDPIALNTTQASWGEHHNPKMASWVTDSSSLNAMLGQNSYRPLQSTEPWINDNNQIQISQFGSGGFSNCFHIDDEHSDLSHK